MRGNLLGPLEGRVARPCPADGVVRKRARAAPLLEVGHVDCGGIDNPVERHHFVVGALGPPFRAGPVVADDVDEERVVHHAHLLQSLHEPSDLLVRMLAKAGERLHLPRLELFLIGRLGRPRRDLLRPLGQVGALRHDAHLLLARKCLLAQHIPTLIELAAVSVDVFLRHVMGGVERARREVHEKRLVRCQRVLRLHPGDRLVRHVHREVVVEAVRLLHAYRSIEDRRRPLVGLAADEAVELVEPRMGRPAIVGARDRDFPGWRLVVLAEGSRAVPVESQHLRERRDALRPDAGIAGERGGQLHDGARVVDVGIAAGQERRARRGAKRRRVEIVETQAAGRQLVQSRHLDRAAEGARLAEADVVQQDYDDVRRALGRLHVETRGRTHIARAQLRDDRGLRLGDRQDRPVDLLRDRILAGAQSGEGCYESEGSRDPVLQDGLRSMDSGVRRLRLH